MIGGEECQKIADLLMSDVYREWLIRNGYSDFVDYLRGDHTRQFIADHLKKKGCGT